MTDLIVLVPGKDEEAAINAMLARPAALGRQLTWAMARHGDRDPGCRNTAPDYLRLSIRLFAHALVIFDREGCVAEALSREQLEQELEGRLSRLGWGDRAAVVVISPELEAWVWSDSRHVDDGLGWRSHQPPLRDWLQQKGFLKQNEVKPQRPKEAMEAAMALVKRRRSSVVYSELGKRVSLGHCVDPSFTKLKTVLQQWFPEKKSWQNYLGSLGTKS